MRALLALLLLAAAPLSAQTIPTDLQGQWSGEGSQRGGTAWRIDIDLDADSGVAFYPGEAPCTARWRFQTGLEPFAFFSAAGHEQIVTGHEHCIDGLGLFLRMGTDGALVVEWRGEDGVPMAIARLARG
ncbi:hypothetical protein C4N9_02500 [Pararhodobacter marinus]|uniref:Alkaline proteinase inhibitor/ Outer membrane lipoprotein Omp19 domain-containing protein n=1 Tax=Pararhodobacter marinus TaxID=2184063 RepID=A0A2U2CJ86_9RHOB|nr:hypothetical protein [Pararhodobacter marinus]PWE31889.1 hypothetical protein C4N9_02500 [Pararhodobacter marinus]